MKNLRINLVTHETRHGLVPKDAVPWAKFDERVLRPLGLSLEKNFNVIDYQSLRRPFRLPPADANILMGSPAVRLLSEGHRSLAHDRGHIVNIQGTPTIATYNVQEATDMTTRFQDDLSMDTEDKHRDEKDGMSIAPANWRAWIEMDIKKLLKHLDTPIEAPRPLYYTAPDPTRLIHHLREIKNRVIYLDIECRRQDHTLDCIGVATDDNPVAVVPVYNHKHMLYYGEKKTLDFLSALGVAFTRNRVVVHNTFFDLWLLAYYYHIPFGHDIYDTMLAQHRCFPELEKSLAASMSMWTNYPYHKDTYKAPNSIRACQHLWAYNARDVHGMREVYKAQLAYAKTVPGLQDSIQQVNASIEGYLISSLQGIRLDAKKLQARIVEADQRLKQLDRIFTLLLGRQFNPNSDKQCRELLHDQMGLPVVKRSRKTKNPILDQTELYKLYARTGDEIPAVIAYYRLMSKIPTLLTFRPYEQDSRDADNRIKGKTSTRNPQMGLRLRPA